MDREPLPKGYEKLKGYLSSKSEVKITQIINDLGPVSSTDNLKELLYRLNWVQCVTFFGMVYRPHKRKKEEDYWL